MAKGSFVAVTKRVYKTVLNIWPNAKYKTILTAVAYSTLDNLSKVLSLKCTT